MQTIGFIGLGNMGFGMVSNLLKSGYKVLTFDVNENKSSELVSLGGVKMDSIQEIAENVEIVVLCLPHPKISKDVIFNKKNLLSPKSIIKTIIDTSTLTPEDTNEFFNKLTQKNIAFLCAPMLGGKQAANNAQIQFLVEGIKEIFQENKKLFDAMGSRTDYIGEVPNATLAKLAYNMCRYGNVAIAAEVARFVRKYSNDTNSIYGLLTEGSLDNFGQVWAEDIKEMVVDGVDYKPSKIPEKDLGLITNLQNKKKLSNKLFKSIRDVYKSLSKSH